VTVLAVVAIVVGCLALILGVVAVVRAHAANETAEAVRLEAELARRAADQARVEAETAQQRADQSSDHSRAAAEQAAKALQRADTAARAATEATASADRAAETSTAALQQVHEVADIAAETSRHVDQIAATATQAIPVQDAAALDGAAHDDEHTQHAEQEHAPERTEPAPAASWVSEQVKGPVWVVRNTGTVTAHSALLTDATQPPKYIRPEEVVPRDVPPQDHLQFRAFAVKGAPPPRVRVIWREDGIEGPRSADMTLLVD
jgi:hypothetical protein